MTSLSVSTINKPPQRRSKVTPGLVLFFLSPIVAELLSGSSPPIAFLLGMPGLLGLYGGGVLIVRELTFRWKKGWPTILLLGAAYAIVEEGLSTKSFFDPKWPDVGILGSYGRWLGVNWVWTEGLTIYHAFISIALPIMLVELMYPKERNQPWVSPKKLKICYLFVLTVVIFGYFFFSTYRPGIFEYFSAVAAVFVFGYLGYRAPASPAVRRTYNLRNPIFGVVAFLTFLSNLILGDSLASSRIPPIGTMLIEGAVLTSFCLFLLFFKAKGGEAWKRFSLACGALGVFVFLSPILEFTFKGTTRNYTGMTEVGVATVVFLVLLGRKIRGREKLEEVQQRSAVGAIPMTVS